MIEVSERRERAVKLYLGKTMESGVHRNAVKIEICICNADGNGVDRRALLLRIFGDGLKESNDYFKNTLLLLP